jgi:hypothetical protein
MMAMEFTQGAGIFSLHTMFGAVSPLVPGISELGWLNATSGESM